MIHPLNFPKHYIAGKIYVKEALFLAAGEQIAQHKHTYEHLGILAVGSVQVEVDGDTTLYTAPTAVTIKAHKVHKITALEAGTLWYCVHATSDAMASAETELVEA
jgi:quercetin dioxygenase-like cupin family protein